MYVIRDQSFFFQVKIIFLWHMETGENLALPIKWNGRSFMTNVSSDFQLQKQLQHCISVVLYR